MYLKSPTILEPIQGELAMEKKRSRSAKRPEVAQGQEAVGPESMTTFSVRLTEEQRDLVTRAAQLRGWTPTNLIRTATLERAAHLVNTSRITKFDFKGLASDVAQRLFEPRIVTHHLSREEMEILLHDHPDAPAVIDVPVQPLPIDTLFQLKRAARLGGSEFVNLIIEFAEGLTASQRADLPDPIDPAATDS